MRMQKKYCGITTNIYKAFLATVYPNFKWISHNELEDTELAATMNRARLQSTVGWTFENSLPEERLQILILEFLTFITFLQLKVIAQSSAWIRTWTESWSNNLLDFPK